MKIFIINVVKEFFKQLFIRKMSKDLRLTESLVGAAENGDYTISQVKEERLSSL